ncbi:DUF6470 family protein [Paenibacillus nasutitermitis]|uniref:Uncharacterized protein n=1 Tax=Paenibacillus nasutitermitis TaxID=1652958 RepID=A0A916ZED3_9BACL|nr:DUF6470 family protein [Paenibacillus nasutitermitis]GGD92237.1 hypothetical protein GCM10010911_58610 [Paenibacillus nasutitermitis]
MTIPMLQIRQTPGVLYVDADPGQFSIRQPKAELHIQTEPGQLEIHQYKPELEVDQSRAFAAYNGGNFLEMNQRIYSGIQQIFLQGLARRVEEGNRAAAIHKPGNTIAEIYGQDWQPVPFPEIRGEASMDNVETRFRITPPDIRVGRTEVDVQTVTHRPEIEYTRGKLDIYMKQYPSVQYIPPELDIAH